MSLIGLLPLLLISIPLAVIIAYIAKRQGNNEGTWFLIGLIPLINYFVLMWLMISIFLDMFDKLRGIYTLIEEQNIEIRKRRQPG